MIVRATIEGRVTDRTDSVVTLTDAQGRFYRIPADVPLETVVPPEPGIGSVVLNRHECAMARRKAGWYFVNGAAPETSYTWEHVVKVMGLSRVIHELP